METPTNEVIESNPLEDQLVKQLAAPILAEHKLNKKFMSRNRKAHLRMNRPEKLEKMERGANMFMRLLTKGEKLMEPTEPPVELIDNEVMAPTSHGVAIDNGESEEGRGI